MDTVNFEESLDPYSAFRKASEDSTVPDQPLWGLLVWQVVGIFLLGLVFVCEYWLTLRLACKIFSLKPTWEDSTTVYSVRYVGRDP